MGLPSWCRLPSWLAMAFTAGVIFMVCGFYSEIIMMYPHQLRDVNIQVLAGFWLLASLTWLCFLATSFSDAGSVPEAFRPEEVQLDPYIRTVGPKDPDRKFLMRHCYSFTGEPEKMYRETNFISYWRLKGAAQNVTCYENKYSNGCRRFCRKCVMFKPDRAHHCSTCGKCYLKFDHHCIFVNNCVAHHNYKYFMLFLFYTSLACLYAAVSLSLAFGTINRVVRIRSFKLTFVFIFSAVMSFAAFGFMMWHVYMITQGVTTLEYMEKTGTGLHGQKWKNLFKRSWIEELKDVFGQSYLLWLVPTLRSCTHNGVQFQPTVVADRVTS